MRSPISIQTFTAIIFVYKDLLAIALNDDKRRSLLVEIICAIALLICEGNRRLIYIIKCI
ncbi:MAG: hypothetical protein ACK5C4_18950 [Pseudanabaena sp.]